MKTPPAKKTGKSAKEGMKIEKVSYTDEDEGKWMERKEINFLLLLIFVAGVLAVLFFGFRIMQHPKVVSIEEMHSQNMQGKLDPKLGYMYNSFSFVYAGGSWFTKVYEPNTSIISNVQLHFGAREAENITVEGDPMLLRDYNATFITFDPTGLDLGHVALSSSEMSIVLASVMHKLPIAACAKNETNACSTRPIVNCENNKKNPIIYIRQSDTAKIIQDGNCIVIMGDKFEMVRAADKLLLMWLGVIQNKNTLYKDINMKNLS